MLQVLERLQREVEEVARAARRVEHRESAQPVEERPVPPPGFVPPFRARGGCLLNRAVGRDPGRSPHQHMGAEVRAFIAAADVPNNTPEPNDGDGQQPLF